MDLVNRAASVRYPFSEACGVVSFFKVELSRGLCSSLSSTLEMLCSAGLSHVARSFLERFNVSPRSAFFPPQGSYFRTPVCFFR